MAIETYIDPMDQFNQGNIISMIGDKNLAGGICRMLSVFWVIESTKNNASTPNVVLHEMTAKGPIYFKQIGQNFKAYADRFVKDGWIGSIIDCLSLGSAQRITGLVTDRLAQFSTTSANATTKATQALAQSTTTPRSCMISFRCPLGGHSIAAIEDPSLLGSTFYIFDPNYGVMTIDTSPFGANGSLQAAIGDLWTAYHIQNTSIAPVVNK